MCLGGGEVTAGTRGLVVKDLEAIVRTPRERGSLSDQMTGGGEGKRVAKGEIIASLCAHYPVV